MDSEQIKRIFKMYADEYRNIFELIYPAKNSTGFPEKNLSVNFARAYDKLAHSNNQRCCAWYEFQFGEKNNLHVDAILFNPDVKELIIIESKRFNNPSKKIEEVQEDIIRIPRLVNELKQENRIDMAIIRNCYGVILADVWNETDTKRDILNSYMIGMEDYNSSESFAKKFLDNPISKKIIYDVQSFKKIDTYYLLSMVWEI